MQIQLGTRGFFDGDSDTPMFEAEALLSKDGSVAVSYVVNRFRKRLISSDAIVLPRGSTRYLGSIALGGIYADSSEMIFLHVE